MTEIPIDNILKTLRKHMGSNKMSYPIQKLLATIICIIGMIGTVAGSNFMFLLLMLGGAWFVLVRIFGDTVKE